MAKNRRTIITELFKAFDKNEEFQYNEDQLWTFFNSCVEDKSISLKKLSKERESPGNDGSGATKTKGKTGYQHFLSEFKDEIPDGEKKRPFKTAAWKSLSDDERAVWNEKVKQLNELDLSIQKKSNSSSDVSNTNDARLHKWKEDMKLWSTQDPSTRGPEPIMIPKSSPKSSNQSSPKSPNESSNQSSPMSITQKEQDRLNELLKEEAEDSDSDSDSDTDSKSDDEDDTAAIDEDITAERMEWLKTYIENKEWKVNVSSHFKAWLMYTDTDHFGPDKDNTMTGPQISDFKKEHDYLSRAKDTDSPWHEFLIINDIISK